ncbi:protocadherin-23 [Macrotis lagotis]|uniref:protocadherin-23 n=1 Tax=Macrotis lagotis TaxID=92651 RepID=UPI003D68D50A
MSPAGSGARAAATLPGLLLHAWLWAASGSWAQVYHLSLAVDEGLPPETPVGDIRAGLPAEQRGQGGGFFLSEDSGDSSLLDDFHVDTATGLIRTARSLDRERRERYGFAAATLLGALVQVEIAVNDVNDHSPRFPRDRVRLEVSELSPPGTALRLPGAPDPDAGRFGTQGYALLQPQQPPGPPAAEGPLFGLRYGGSPPALEPLELVLLRRLDREAAAAHELTVEAWDGGSPRRGGRLRVELRVLDENDNPPAFSQSEYRAAVREDAPPGTEVCRLRASDPDLGPNGDVRYSLRARPGAAGPAGAPEAGAFFSVEERSGVVRVRRPLDREAQARHRLLVEARDGGAQPETASALLSIAVLDVNDNPPAIHLLFLTEGGGAQVSEGARRGDYVARVSVSDPDGDPEEEEEEEGAEGGAGRRGVALALEGGAGSFALRPGGPRDVFFLCVEGPLDRESRSGYQLRLVATDAGSPPLSTRETLWLRVTDVNDQAPRFGRERYHASVSEAAAPGTALLRLSASDGDEPGTAQARVRYSLGPALPTRDCGPEAAAPAPDCAPPAFAVDPESGVISTTRALDREAQEALQLQVVARDLGQPPLSSTCWVTVTVEDVNDNEPVFQRQLYEAEVAEHSPPGHCFLQVKASDADSGQYGHIEYFLYDGFHSSEKSQAFQIDPHSGHICVSQDIDREQGPATYDLLVKAQDGGGLSAQAFVRVELKDVNDNQPVFNPTSYVTSISGHTQPGTEILNVVATDRDAGIYGVVAYELIPGDFSSLFTVDSATGIIYLISTLGHLESTSVFLTVSARDGGGLTSIINADVTIHILWTALAPAIFERSKYVFSIHEDVPEDSPVGTVKAREPINSLETVSYRISSGDPYGSFTIDSRFGVIRTRKQLDHETQPRVILTILSQLGNSPVYSSTQVNITVIDVNDNPPIFHTASDEVRLLQSTLPGTALYIAHAEDKDSGQNGFIQYTIENQRSRIFSIDSDTGVIYLSKNLGQEIQQGWILHIRAKDLGVPPLTSLLMLTVTVEKPDVIPLSKEKPPVSRYIQHLVIPENFKPAKVMSLIKSPDYLQQHNGKFQLSIVEEDKDIHFEIDSSTGDLFLSRKLDYEMTSHYLLRVTTKDNSQNPPLNSTIFLSIDVEDQNDHYPFFQDDFIVISIKENVSVGTLVYTFNAKDGDGSFLNSKVQYFIENKSPYENPFLIHPSYGTLVTASPLDRETVQSFVLTVTASDQAVNLTDRKLRTMTAKVVILDVNDHSPSFVSSAVTYISEDEEIGSVVHHIVAKDPDEGRNGRITYHILSGNENKTFMLDEISGLLTTICPLDYEVQTFHVLTLLSLDDGLPALSTTQTLTIYVLDINDEAPEFKQYVYEATVAENQSPGQYVTKVEAVDRDSGINSQLQYEIMPMAISGLFKINSSTGEVVTAATLDRETQESFTLRVLVKDQGVPPLSSTVTILCSVEDENDHAPKFIIPNPEIRVPENKEPGVIYTILAMDMDSGNNGAVRYHIIGGNTEQLFTINETSGELSTTCSLDREHINNFNLIIECYDLGNPGRSSTTELKVTILDDNDHSPSFPTSHYQACVKEDLEVGSVILELSAVDEDGGLNGQVEYFLTSDALGIFIIDRMAGTLKLAQGLDRETRSQYVFRVVASDCSVQSPRSTTVDVTVNVDDVNDNSPVFGQNPLDVFVSSQMSVNQTIATMISYDSDLGSNGAVVFNFAETQSLFHIDEHSGEIQLQKQLSSAHFPVWLQVKAMDQGIPTRTAIGLLVIHMEEKDARFSFSQQLYTSTITENCETGTPIVTVKAFTPEFSEKGINYWIFNGNENGIFSLNSKTGELTVKEPTFLDFEIRNEITLIILAESDGDKTHCKVAVLIEDMNDNVPVFQPSTYQASVSEGQPFNTQIMQIFAADLDSGLNGQIEYSILSGNQDEAFQIDATSGVIATNTILDYELTNSYSLVVQAADKGMPRLSATTMVKIQVVDLNDNIPVFLPSEQVEVPESIPVGSVVTRVYAHDRDSDPALDFSFTKGGNPGNRFSIDCNTGAVMLAKPLDFEEGHEYELLVEVSDSVHNTEALFKVYVMDINDNAPIFLQDFYQVTLSEMTPVGSAIFTVTATDQDAGNNGKISYKILSPTEGFSIDPQNGSIFTVKPVMHPDKTSIIQLLVEAKDGGIPGLTALTLVELEIQDVNNHAPQFTTEYYNITVSENAVTGTTLLTFSAIDHDWTHENTYIEYSIISGNLQNTFQVETRVIPSGSPYKRFGHLVLSHPLDRETLACHKLIILAYDHGHPQLNSTATILIDVLDANDNPPIFSSPDYYAHVKENLPIGSQIVVVSAKDHDIGVNSEVTYTIISGNERGHFQIHGETGVIELIKILDYEDISLFTLTVQASNRGTNNFAFSVVSISVLDDNDHVPQFMFSSLNCVVPENLPNFSVMCTAHALDFDSGPYGHLTYSIQSSCVMNQGIPPDHDLFFIDPLTGDIFAKQILDYESENKHCFIVQAEDKGEAKATLMVQVDVEGIDEYEPIFTQDQYFFSLPETHHIRHIIGKVEASDADAGIDGLVLYTFATSSSFLSINKTSGNIYWIRDTPFVKSDNRKDDMIEMKVTAHSPKMDSKSSSCTIFVNVSSFPQEGYYTLSVNSLSISLTASIVIFLLFVISLVALILRYKRKDTMTSCGEKKVSSSSPSDLSLTSDPSILKDSQKAPDMANGLLPMGSMSEWLNLVDMREKKDMVNPCRHSDSSGHCSVEGDTAEDEEIKRINEHPCRKGSSSVLSDRGSRVPDSGIPRDSDQLSCLSGETDVVITTETLESSFTFEGVGERCDAIYAQNKVLSQTFHKIGMKDKTLMEDSRRDFIFISNDQDSRYGSLATLEAPTKDLRSSYDWDYLLNWEPQFQPLSSVFNDIAKLKDELQVPGLSQGKKSFVFPPPLITSVAQPGLKAVPPRMPSLPPEKAFKKYPRSPLHQHLPYPPAVMTPSFSPSLSLLTMESPAMSPQLPDSGLLGTCLVRTAHGPRAEEEVGL